MNLIRSVCVLALLGAGANLCAAQGTASPAKKELVQKVVQLQQPAVEAAARQLAEQSVLPMVQQLNVVVQQRVAPEQREALGRDVQAELRKYGDETVGLLRERAVKLAPTTIGPVLEERLSEDELKQVIAMLEAPIYRKYHGLGADMQKALVEKLIAETRSTIEPKLKALQDAVGKRVNEAVAASAASAPAAGAKPAAPRASGPAPKK